MQTLSTLPEENILLESRLVRDLREFRNSSNLKEYLESLSFHEQEEYLISYYCAYFDEPSARKIANAVMRKYSRCSKSIVFALTHHIDIEDIENCDPAVTPSKYFSLPNCFAVFYSFFTKL